MPDKLKINVFKIWGRRIRRRSSGCANCFSDNLLKIAVIRLQEGRFPSHSRFQKCFLRNSPTGKKKQEAKFFISQTMHTDALVKGI